MNQALKAITVVIILIFFWSCNSNIQTLESKNAHDFNLKSLDGKIRTLQSYQGKKIMLNFWATWCPPCVAELPALSQIAQRYKDKDLVVITVNTDPESQWAKVRELYAKNSYKFEVVFDPELEIAQKYGVKGFPETFFIKNGKIVNFYDAKEKKNSSKIISDREWDSNSFKKSFDDFVKLSSKKGLIK